ncbi:lectin C-type domain protein [Ostertagia ostertagi]
MMVLFYVHCFVLLLWSLYPACQTAVDDDTVARAKEGAWVTLRDGVNEAPIKVAKMSEVGDPFDRDIFDRAEEFCKQDDSHLTSVLSENEMKFIGELVIRIYGAFFVDVLTGLRMKAPVTWSDGSPTDFVRNFQKDVEAEADGRHCLYGSEALECMRISLPPHQLWSFLLLQENGTTVGDTKY